MRTRDAGPVEVPCSVITSRPIGADAIHPTLLGGGCEPGRTTPSGPPARFVRHRSWWPDHASSPARNHGLDEAVIPTASARTRRDLTPVR